MSTARTLMLSQSYEPLKVIPWQKAITLLTLNKVEIIEEYDQDIRSTFLVIKMPAVVRLISKFRRFKKPVKFSRANIYARDRYKCQYCGEQFPIHKLTYDHVTPRAQGGKTVWENIVTCCETCNRKKGNRTPKQAGTPLRSKPVQPTWIPSVAICVSRRSVPDAWRDYLFWTSELLP